MYVTLYRTNREAVLEMTRNFQLMFWDCQRRCELPSRTICSQVYIFSLSSPNRVDAGQIERPKFDIDQETLVELRSLGFSWEDMAHTLLVSRWTTHRRYYQSLSLTTCHVLVTSLMNN